MAQETGRKISDGPSQYSTSYNTKKVILKKELATALEQDDPLAPYDRLIKHISESGSRFELDDELVEILEETTRIFKEDAIYKGDLRYLKIWILYAKCTRKPDAVYKYLIERDIGTVYCHLYEEYATVLEKQGRIKEADTIYQRGIQRPCRALDSLKVKYREFRDRVAGGMTLQNVKDKQLSENKGTKADELRRNPLMQIVQKSYSDRPSSLSAQNGYDPYVYMQNPQPTSKRPERLRFDLSLLFKDGKESCFEEARARSLGLLGKKWGTPAVEAIHNLGRSQQHVDQSDDGSKSSNRNLTSNMNLTLSMAGEPTVTINTKAALNDVFGMYNSPEKSQKFTSLPGSKHAPIKKILSLQNTPKANNIDANLEENSLPPLRNQSFRPFIDEDIKKENATPAISKFMPFVDEDAGQSAAKTPMNTPGARRALSLKENATPAPAFSQAKTQLKHEQIPVDEVQSGPVFSRVFTPAGTKRQLQSPQERDESNSSDNKVSASTLSDSKVISVETYTIGKVFSRPNTRTEAPLKESVPLSKIEQYGRHTAQDLQASNNGHEYAGKTVECMAGDSVFELDHNYKREENFTESSAPLSHFAKFSVMTPIIERTLEFTTSTRYCGTPGDVNGDDIVFRKDAAEAAEIFDKGIRRKDDIVPPKQGDKLTKSDAEGQWDEYQVDSEEQIYEEDRFISEDLIERTGTLSLADAIEAASSFKPPNPCVPTDPQIITTLLSLGPPDPGFHDFTETNSNLFQELQKYAPKPGRRVSRDAGHRHSFDKQGGFPLRLGTKQYQVTEKLGEGGFGAVFLARDISLACAEGDDDSYELEEEDDDEDSCMVAIKVVRPRSIWEYHILRRLHNSATPRLKESIVRPHNLYAFRDESYLVMEWCRQGTLLDVVNQAVQAGVAHQGGCLDELLVMFFAVELLRFIEGIHSVGIIHGDLKIDNCLLRLDETAGGGISAWSGMYQPTGDGGWKFKGIKIIDFGRTIDTRMFPSGQQFVADWSTDARDCIEMRENRPWSYQADYYGLAGIVYCMLFGKYLEDSSLILSSPSGSGQARLRLATPFKRYWQVEIWTHTFDILLNSSLTHADGSLPLCSEISDIRSRMEDWLQNNCNRSSNTLKGLLKKVELSVLSATK